MPEDRGSRGIAAIEASKHAAAAQRRLHTARKCHERLRALAESRGEPKTCGEDAVRKNIAEHLRNAEFPMAKAEPAEAPGLAPGPGRKPRRGGLWGFGAAFGEAPGLSRPRPAKAPAGAVCGALGRFRGSHRPFRHRPAKAPTRAVYGALGRLPGKVPGLPRHRPAKAPAGAVRGTRRLHADGCINAGLDFRHARGMPMAWNRRDGGFMASAHRPGRISAE